MPGARKCPWQPRDACALVSGALTASSLAAVSFGSLGGASAAAAASLPKCSVSALGKATGVVDVDLESASRRTRPRFRRSPTPSTRPSRRCTSPGTAGRLRRHLEQGPSGPHQRAAPDIAQLEDQRTQGVIGQRASCRSVVHERLEVLDVGLPHPTAQLLEGERGPVGAPLRRLGPDRLLQQAGLHKAASTPQPPLD